MGIVCLSECPACSRHLQCGERRCPFCGTRVTSLMRVLDFRIRTPLARSRLFSMGAALAAAGFAVNCDVQVQPMYGAPCLPAGCGAVAGISGNATGGLSGSATVGGTDQAGTAPSGGSSGAPSAAGATGRAGESNGGGSSTEGGGAAGQAGDTSEGGAGGAR